MALRVNEVFTPGSVPDHTYVERQTVGLEQRLLDSLETPGMIVSIGGPSKSGKTVLVEKVVGPDMLITIPGAAISSPSDVWNYVLDWIDAPASTSSSRAIGGGLGLDVGAKGGVGVPLVAKGEVSAMAHGTLSGQLTGGTTRNRTGLQQVLREIGGSSFVVLIDDFHYMKRDLQVEVSNSLKEAVRLGIKVVTAAVTHRGDDVVRANPELRGRVQTIDLTYWTPEELAIIAKTGFGILNSRLDDDSISSFAQETAGSPQLMQLLCLEACRDAGLRDAHSGPIPKVLNFDAARRRLIYEKTSTATDNRSLLSVLDSGPPLRGTKRTIFQFTDGTSGDVYRAVLKAVAGDPPQLSFTYRDLLIRTGAITEGDGPGGSSVTSTCVHMSRLAQSKMSRERPIDWDESTQVFDLPDPYLMFYLRWSGKLTSDQRQINIVEAPQGDSELSATE